MILQRPFSFFDIDKTTHCPARLSLIRPAIPQQGEKHLTDG